MEKRNSQVQHGRPMEQTRGLVCTSDFIVLIPDLASLLTLMCGSLSITTPVSLLANEFDVRSVFHGQVSFAAVN